MAEQGSAVSMCYKVLTVTVTQATRSNMTNRGINALLSFMQGYFRLFVGVMFLEADCNPTQREAGQEGKKSVPNMLLSSNC